MTPAPGGRPDRSAHDLVAAWAVLIGMGGTSLTFNIYHAAAADGHVTSSAHQAAGSGVSGHLALGLAVLYGLAPVGAAMGLSHLAGSYRTGREGRVMQAVTVIVMLGAMALSVGATAAVVAPVAPGLLRFVFPAVMDAASLVALRVILAPHPAEVAPATPAATTPAPATNQGATRPVPAPVSGPATRPPATATTAPDVAVADRPDAPGMVPPPVVAGGRNARVLELTPRSANDTGTGSAKRGETRQVMRDYWDAEIARGRIPNGAQLNRAAGKDSGYSLGKRYAQEWRQEINDEPENDGSDTEWRAEPAGDDSGEAVSGEG
jgi:hypothetical protein